MGAKFRGMGFASALAVVLAFAGYPLRSHAVLDEDCVINVLNRTVQVAANGGWSMPNVPANMGQIRARATCIQESETRSGETDYFVVAPNAITRVGDVKFGENKPAPVSLAFSQQGTTTLAAVDAAYQVGLFATFSDGAVQDVTAATSGTNYRSTAPGIASVSADGLVRAVSSGTALISARKDEVVAIKQVLVTISGDSDGDGLPDDYELANGLDSNDPIDAQEDQDSDGLTTAVEFQLGTDPGASDTDGDGISDGDEVAGENGFVTNPLEADSDGDGLGDRVELLAGSDPTDSADRDFAGALDRVTVTPSSAVLTFNTINNEASSQLQVTGILIDGSTIDLTRRTTGTTYASSDLSVVSFGLTDGEIFAGQAGDATVTVTNSGKQFVVAVHVETFQPVALSALDIPGYANNVDVAGDYAYVAAGAAGLQVVDVSNRGSPKIVASLDTDGTAIDVRVYGTFVYLADGASGLKIIDISDPLTPVLAAAIDTAGIAQDLEIDGQLAYIADGAPGLIIVDVGDPSAPVVKGELEGLGDTKGVDVSGTRAVVVGGTALFVVDIATPAAPMVVGSVGLGSAKDVVVDGDFAYVAAYSTGYRVVDLTTPSAPVIIGGDASVVPRDVELSDGFAFFAEQLFPNVVAFVNVRNPVAPVFQGIIDLSRLGDYAGTGIAVDGSYVYATEESYVVSSDYQASGTTKLFIAQYRLINDNAGIAPQVAITKPAANAEAVEGTTITVSAVAGDDVGVRAVTFAVNGQTVLVDTTQPYQIPVAVPLGSSGITISASATDFGNNTSIAEINLRVLADRDRDGLGDDQEVLQHGTDPLDPDTDGDELQDGAEVALGTNPLEGDSDEDGLSDKQEVDEGTDPLNPDVTAPTVTATDPAADAEGIAENHPVTISFSELLSPKSVRSDSIRVTLNGNAVPGTVQLLASGSDIVFTQAGLLNDFTQYGVVVSGVRDAAGNPLAAPFEFAYTTGNTVDTTAPAVAASNPGSGAVDVPVNVPVTVVFDEPVDPATITENSFFVQDTVGRIGGVGELGADGRTLSFVPSAALSVGRNHTVYLQGVRDFFGNALHTAFGFRTGYVSDGVAPQIASTTVRAGQTGVPTNAAIGIAFDEPVSVLSLTTLQLLTGGQPIPVTRQLNAAHSIVNLVPAQPLQPDTDYVLTVSGVTDLSGNVQAVERTVSFTTGAGADLVAPVAVSVTPVNGATGVPLDALIEKRFNEPMNPLMISDTSVKLYDSVTGQFVVGTPGLSADGLTVTFTPAAALAANRLYYYYTTYNTYVEDLAGNRYSGSTTFTTGSSVSAGEPQVLLQSVADGATGIPVNGRLVFEFDTPLRDSCVNGETVQVSADGAAAAGTLSLSADRRKLTFTPDGTLAVSTEYTVTLDGVCDLAGNELSGVTSSFTTSATATADTERPTVTIVPTTNATNVSPDTTVTLTFSEPVDPTTLAGGIQVTVPGLGGEVAGELSVNGTVVTFTPAAPLPGDRLITVSATSAVLDLAGNVLVARNQNFTTGAAIDSQAPQVVSITPNDLAVDIGTGTPIVLTFSESLNPNTVNGSTFALFVNGSIVNPSVSRSGDNRTVTLTAGLPASSVVAVIATSGVQDLSGNALADYTSVFTTAAVTDAGRPSVVTQFPGNGASGVLEDASVVLYTSEPMNESTLQDALHIAQDGQLVAGTVTLSASGRAIEFEPLQPWSPNALVEVFVDNTAQDVSGNALNNYQGSFRVTTAAAAAPVAVATSPTYGSNTVPINTVVDLQYSEALDPATVTTESVRFYDYSIGQYVASGSASVIKGGRVIRVVPQAPLEANAQYGVYATGIKDPSGLTANDYFMYFVTNAAEVGDTQAPEVELMSPADGVTDVGINAHVHVRFDEPVNPISLLGEAAQTTYGSLSWSNGNREVEFVRHSPYAVNTAVTESVADVEDLAANAVSGPSSVTFTTGSGPDFTTPQLVDGTPFNAATNVPVNAALRLSFDEPLDPVAINSSTVYLYDGRLGVIASSATLEADGRTVSYVPSQALAVNRNYYVYAYPVKDLAGNVLYTYRSFTTALAADGDAPLVVGTSVPDGMTGVPVNAGIGVVFDEAIDERSLVGIELLENGSPVVASLAPSADHRMVTLKLLQPLQPDTDYVLTVSGVTDLSGNVQAVERTVSFTTGAGADLVAPVAVSVTPVNGATGVPLDALIEKRFNEPMNPLMISDTSVKLYDSVTGQFVVGTPGLSADGLTVTFTPAAALAANRLYYYYTTYNTYVEDLAGNRYSGSTTFTTGSSVSAGEPQVLLQSVADGATGIPVNGRLVFEFDTPLRDSCVNGETVQVSADGAAAAGTLSLSADRRKLTFTPDGTLAVSTEYTVTLDGVCDLAGNELSGVTSSFTTSATATADTERPTVTIVPTTNATNVSPDTTVTLTFSEPVDPTTLAGGIQVTVPGLGGEVAGELSVNGTVVTFTPAAPLPGDRLITVSATSAVLDLAGNVLVARNQNFTTGAAIDSQAPQVVSITPNDLAVDIGTGTPIVLTFSESLNPNTVNGSTFALFVNGSIVNPSVSRSGDNRTVTLTAGLPASSVVAVIATSGVQDLSGNALADYTSVFTTAAVTDAGRPSVVTQFPGNGASGVLEDASVVLYTSEPMNESTLQDALHIAQDGQLVAGTVTLSASGRAIEFEPLQPWSPNALVEVFVDNTAQDVSGNALNNYQGSFRVTTAAAAAPVAVATSPTYGSNTVPINTVVDLQYSEALDPATVTTESVRFYDYSIGQYVASGSASVIKGGRVIRVVPQAPLEANAQYGVYATGIKDPSGLTANDYFMYFVTNAAEVGDTQAPEVELMSPADGVTDVGINAHVHVRFDEPVNPISLLGEAAQTTYGSLSWSNGNREVEFVRHSPYAVNTAVTESVADVEDLAANAVSGPSSVTFTTGSGPDFTTPQLVDGTPFNAATNVPVNAVIKLRFNEMLDPLGVNASTTYLYFAGAVPGTATLEADGRTISYVPTETLGAGQQYTVYAYPVRDLSGNVQYTYRSFTTALAADGDAPLVVGTSVPDGMTGVPVNAGIGVVFDEAIDEQSLAGIELLENGSLVVASPAPSADHRMVTLKLLQPLQPGTEYVLNVSGVTDLSGNVLAAERTAEFTTGAGADLVAPVAVSVTPVSGATEVALDTPVEKRFNEPMNRLSISDTSVKLYDSSTGQFVVGTPGLSADGLTVTFTPAAALAANRLYYYYTTYNTYVEDLAGNRFSGSTTFRTAP